MQRITHANGVVTYTFDMLAQFPLNAHVSTRHGGVSPAPWNTLNFSVARGDSRDHVEENRRRFAEAGGIDAASCNACAPSAWYRRGESGLGSSWRDAGGM